MGSVEIQSAFKWTCIHCGQLNFHAGIAAELTEEQRKTLEAEMRAQAPPGSEWIPEGTWIMAPKEVECSRCQTKYKGVYGDEEESADPTEPFPES